MPSFKEPYSVHFIPAVEAADLASLDGGRRNSVINGIVSADTPPVDEEPFVLPADAMCNTDTLNNVLWTDPDNSPVTIESGYVEYQWVPSIFHPSRYVEVGTDITNELANGRFVVQMNGVDVINDQLVYLRFLSSPFMDEKTFDVELRIDGELIKTTGTQGNSVYLPTGGTTSYVVRLSSPSGTREIQNVKVAVAHGHQGFGIYSVPNNSAVNASMPTMAWDPDEHGFCMHVAMRVDFANPFPPPYSPSVQRMIAVSDSSGTSTVALYVFNDLDYENPAFTVERADLGIDEITAIAIDGWGEKAVVTGSTLGTVRTVVLDLLNQVVLADRTHESSDVQPYTSIAINSEIAFPDYVLTGPDDIQGYSLLSDQDRGNYMAFIPNGWAPVGSAIYTNNGQVSICVKDIDNNQFRLYTFNQLDGQGGGGLTGFTEFSGLPVAFSSQPIRSYGNNARAVFLAIQGDPEIEVRAYMDNYGNGEYQPFYTVTTPLMDVSKIDAAPRIENGFALLNAGDGQTSAYYYDANSFGLELVDGKPYAYDICMGNVIQDTSYLAQVYDPTGPDGPFNPCSTEE